MTEQDKQAADPHNKPANIFDRFRDIIGSCTTPEQRLFAFVSFFRIITKDLDKNLSARGDKQSSDFLATISHLRDVADDISLLIAQKTQEPDKQVQELRTTLATMYDVFERDIGARQRGLQELGSKVSHKLVDDIFTPLSKIATSYFRTVTTVGYASFFAAWAVTKSSFDPLLNLLIGVFIVTSVSFYILNELLNAAATVTVTEKLRSIDTNDPDRIVESLDDMVDLSQTSFKVVNILRAPLLYGSIGFAIPAISMLVAAFLISLVNEL